MIKKHKFMNTEFYLSEIARLKKEKNAVILAHYYQTADIQEIADYVGDSLGLSQQAAQSKADMIVFAGVHFMAETAKILSPKAKVVLPDITAGCSLADSCPSVDFKNFKEQHPNHLVISYINCSAEIKTLSDIICTSGNALQIVNSLSKDEKIIFAPDRNLGGYINKITGRDMILWNGSCEVHDLLTSEAIIKLKISYPNALLIAHPECQAQVLELADFVGSTTAMLAFSRKSKHKQIIVATESGILHQMQKESPEKEFIIVPSDESCSCNDCPYMKLNTLEKIYLCMKNESPEIVMNPELIKNALVPINRMLDISKKLGLI